MNKKHHTSQQISKQLVEAGIVIESDFWWQYTDVPLPDGTRWVVKHKSRLSEVDFELSSPSDIIPAPIATELLERLPKYLTDEDDMNWHLNISYDDYNTPYLSYQLNGMEWFNAVTDDTVSDALALLLIRLKDGLI